MKTCVDCGQIQPPANFHRNRGYRDGLQRRCKDCTRIYNRNYLELPGKKEKARAAARRQHLRGYGLTPELFDAMLAAQGGRCAICRTDTPGGVGTWHIDHDHACCDEQQRSCGNCVRALLCNPCNHRVAVFEAHGDAIAAYLALYRKAKS